MNKLDQFDGFAIIDKEVGTVEVLIGATALSRLLAAVAEMSANTTIYGIEQDKDCLFGEQDLTELVAQRAAQDFVEDHACDVTDPDWSESAPEFVSAHAQDHLDTEISTAQSGANAHKSEMRSLRSTYQSNVL